MWAAHGQFTGALLQPRPITGLLSLLSELYFSLGSQEFKTQSINQMVSMNITAVQ